MTKTVVIEVPIPTDLREQCLIAVNPLIFEASRQWGVDLTDEQKLNVSRQSVAQVITKLKSISHSLDVGRLSFKVKMDFDPDDSPNVIVSRSSPNYSHLMFRLHVHKWFSDEDSTIALDELPPFIEGIVDETLRNAVFYGVGSYVRNR